MYIRTHTAGLSYYYIAPKMPFKGKARFNGKNINIQGNVWFEHQWGNIKLPEGKYEIRKMTIVNINGKPFRRTKSDKLMNSVMCMYVYVFACVAQKKVKKIAAGVGSLSVLMMVLI